VLDKRQDPSTAFLFLFFSLLTALVKWSNPTSSLSPGPDHGWGGNQETGMTGLIGKVILNRDANKKGIDRFIVIIFLDGAAPFQFSGLSIKTLKGNVKSFVLRPGLSIP
jgi:hypothetical protein